MKKLLLLFFVAATVSLNAQQTNSDILSKFRGKDIHINDASRTMSGNEVRRGGFNPVSLFDKYQDQTSQTAQTHADDGKEEWVGETYYDLQTNGTSQNRMTVNADEDAKVVWIFHEEIVDSEAFPNRGTGFNESIGGEPFTPYTEITERIEDDTRTGWPTIGTLGDGSDIIINHAPSTDNGPDLLMVLKRGAGETEWTESFVPSLGDTLGLLWPRMAVTGQTVHMIAVSTPTGNGGVAFEGLNPALFYFRSSDGGNNWDIQYQTFESLDTTEVTGVNADSYVIECDDSGNVAIATFGLFSDVKMIKSTDGGNNWESTVVNEFPFFPFEGGTTDYTFEDIGGFDPNGLVSLFPGEDLNPWDSLMFLTNDGTGSLTIDQNGGVHVVFPTQYATLATPDLDPGFISTYNFPSGIQYWNESFGPDNPQKIESVENHLYYDADTLRIPQVSTANPDETAEYGGHEFITMPSIGSTDDGRLVIAYMRVMENLVRVEESDAFPRQHYHHIHLTGSADGGTTWTTPFDVINDQTLVIPSLATGIETAFPFINYIEDDRFALYYMWDEEPGLNLRPENDQVDPDEIASNVISFMRFSAEDMFGLPEVMVNTETVEPADLGFAVAPNPAQATAFVNFTLKEAAKVSLTVTNIVGQQVAYQDLSQLPAGYQNHEIDVNSYTPGMYLVTLRVDDLVSTQKLVVNAN